MNKVHSKTSEGRLEVVTLGGGCFWCTEAVFSEIRGVTKVESGYSGGDNTSPTYDEVSTGETGHVEVVQVSFNPSIISFREILEIFFSTHDPTTVDRQGPDTGSQYRSVIFYHSDEQKKISEEVVADLSDRKIWSSPIVTKIEPFRAFFGAEEYHNNYFKKHPEQSYCRLVIDPKMVKLRRKYKEKLKEN